LIESYNNETDTQIKQNLDKTASETSYNLPDKNIPEVITTINLNTSITPTQKITYNIGPITRTFSGVGVKTFKLKGSPINNIKIPVPPRGIKRFTPSEYYEAIIKIEFKEGTTVRGTKIITINQLDQEIIVFEKIQNYSIDSIVISGQITPLNDLLAYETFQLSEIDLYEFDVIQSTKS
jgi:hypothetical protein